MARPPQTRPESMSAPKDRRHNGSAGNRRGVTPAEQQEERRRRQVAALAQLDCLHDVPPLVLLQLAPLCTLRAFPHGAMITSERIASPFVYLVLRGTVSLTLYDRAGHRTLIGVLDRGDVFGEGPLFGDLFRGATAHAETACYLLQLPLHEVRRVMSDALELTAALRPIYRRRLVEGTLARVPMLSALSPVERSRIAPLLLTSEHERGALIIQQGNRGDSLYLIESGQVVVERDGKTIAYLDEGDFFGEMSLLTRQPHNADVRAMTPVTALALPAAELNRLLDLQPLLKEELHAIVEQRRRTSAAMRNDEARIQDLSIAVERGVLRGTHLIVRDSQLCVEGCRICENACATRHGHTRIHVEGVNINGLHVTDTCRQCRSGAECVEACPENAIQWNNQGALIITDNCTGCGECVPACPYDAVQRVPRAAATDDGPLWSLWRKFKQRHIGTIPLEPAKPTHRADKCDLCHRHDDLACVSACPTGALRLVPVEELFPL